MEKCQVLPKLGTSASETFQMIKQVCSKEVLACSAVFKFHRHCTQGRNNLECDEHTSWPRKVELNSRYIPKQ
jgi:hypothetical protein